MALAERPPRVPAAGSPFVQATPDTVVIHRALRPSIDDPFAGNDAAMTQPACLRGRGCGRYAPASAAGCTMLASLRGTLEISSVDGVFQLRRRHFLCLPDHGFAKVMAGKHSSWMALRLPQAYLARLSDARLLPTIPAPLLLPASMPLDRSLMRSISELLRTSACAARDIDGDSQVVAVLVAAIAAQAESTDWVRRAYGRSERHRRAVVVRLLGARNRIANAPFLPHDLESLAAAARYSPSHFLRSFRCVFGKTPRELLTELRLAMACELIRGSDLAICDIASNVGYESRHAFSRLFKRRTGSTATNFRCVASGEARGQHARAR